MACFKDTTFLFVAYNNATFATLYGKLYTKQLFSTGNVSVIYGGIMTTRHLRHVTLSTFLTVDIMARDIVAVDIPPPHPWGEIS